LGLGLVLDFLAAGGPEGEGAVWTAVCTTSTTLISDLSDLVEDPVSRLFRLPAAGVVVAALDEGGGAWSNMISSFCKRGRSRESPPPPPPLVTTGG